MGGLDRWLTISEIYKSSSLKRLHRTVVHSLLSLSSQYRRLAALHVDWSASVTCSLLYIRHLEDIVFRFCGFFTRIPDTRKIFGSIINILRFNNKK
jgi:hypothetical protein